MDSGEEVSGRFVVAGGDGAVLLELAEEILDEVAFDPGITPCCKTRLISLPGFAVEF